MAITKSAKKAHRSSLKKRVYNLRRARVMKDEVSEVKALAAAGKKDEARAALSKAYAAIDKAAKGNTIKKGAASRKKSRLAAAIKRAA